MMPLQDRSSQTMTDLSETGNEAIKKTYRSGCHIMKEPGIYFGLHYSRVSRIINAKDKS